MSTNPFEVTLDPIVWPEGDEYRDPAVYRARERFWWHATVAREIRTQAEQGRPACCIAGIAGNIKMSYLDVYKYARMMITWGELVKAEPLHDFEPDSWVRLADQDGST